MTMETPKYRPEIKRPLLRAMKMLGYEKRDINGKYERGLIFHIFLI